jgi:hypothetical protein
LHGNDGSARRGRVACRDCKGPLECVARIRLEDARKDAHRATGHASAHAHRHRDTDTHRQAVTGTHTRARGTHTHSTHTGTRARARIQMTRNAHKTHAGGLKQAIVSPRSNSTLPHFVSTFPLRRNGALRQYTFPLTHVSVPLGTASAAWPSGFSPTRCRNLPPQPYHPMPRAPGSTERPQSSRVEKPEFERPQTIRVTRATCQPGLRLPPQTRNRTCRRPQFNCQCRWTRGRSFKFTVGAGQHWTRSPSRRRQLEFSVLGSKIKKREKIGLTHNLGPEGLFDAL